MYKTTEEHTHVNLTNSPDFFFFNCGKKYESVVKINKAAAAKLYV